MGHPGSLILPFDPIVTMLDEPFYAVDQTVFAESLKARWSNARMSRIKRTVYKRVFGTENVQKQYPDQISRYELGWSITDKGDDERLYGVHIENSAITLTPFPANLAAEFVKWYRQLVSEEISLYLFTFDMGAALHLTSQTTRDEILSSMGLSP